MGLIAGLRLGHWGMVVLPVGVLGVHLLLTVVRGAWYTPPPQRAWETHHRKEVVQACWAHAGRYCDGMVATVLLLAFLGGVAGGPSTPQGMLHGTLTPGTVVWTVCTALCLSGGIIATVLCADGHNACHWSAYGTAHPEFPLRTAWGFHKVRRTVYEQAMAQQA